MKWNMLLLFFFQALYAQESLLEDEPLPIQENHTVRAPIPTVSKKTPDLFELTTLDKKLENTVWMTTDLENNIDLYVSFYNSSKSIANVARGQQVVFSQKPYPIKYVQEGYEPNSAIFIVTSSTQILYYSFRLITPFYLGISSGYNSIEPLLNIDIYHYFKEGYIFQIITKN